MKNNSTFLLNLIPKTNYITTSFDDLKERMDEENIDIICECNGTLVEDSKVSIDLINGYTFPDGNYFPCISSFYFYHHYSDNNYSDSFELFEKCHIGYWDFSKGSSLIDFCNNIQDYLYKHQLGLSCYEDESEMEFDCYCLEPLIESNLALVLELPRKLLTYKNIIRL